MPEPSAGVVVLDTDVASRSFKGLLPPRLAARLAGWAAACCLAYGLPLATLNVKDFAGFAEHDGLILIRT